MASNDEDPPTAVPRRDGGRGPRAFRVLVRGPRLANGLGRRDFERGASKCWDEDEWAPRAAAEGDGHVSRGRFSFQVGERK